MTNITIAALLAEDSIVGAIKQAWTDSNPGLSGGHEEGGFIGVDIGRLSVVRWPKGLLNEIVLPSHIDCMIGNSVIVASFHTHPNTGPQFQQEPSLTDLRAVSDDFDLKGDFYLGEFVISEQYIYMVDPSGEYHEVCETQDVIFR